MRANQGFCCLMAMVTAISIAGAPAYADTIATFADPVTDGSDYLFEYAAGMLSGGWADTGLTLITPINGGSYDDVTFTMDTLSVDPSGLTSGGTIEFWEAGGGLEPLLRITFDHAQLYPPFGVGASSLITDHNVEYSGQIISGTLDNEMFAFSFANQNETPAGFTWSAAFTSSAIPEPAVLTLIIVGGLMTAFNRRRS